MHISELPERRRQRELASDERAGSWARHNARRTRHEFIRRNWHFYVGAVALLVLPLLIAVPFLPTAFLQGLAIGADLVAIPLLLWSWTVQLTGTAQIMMGDQAEQWTAQELRKARRKHWRLVNHLALSKVDIDHLAIGTEGVYAFETKWTGTEWSSPYGQQRLEAAVSQARASARSLMLWQPFRSRQIPVYPVVVLWGGNASDLIPSAGLERNGCVVVAGRDLRSWARRLSADTTLDDTVVSELWGECEAHVRRRDAVELTAHPVPWSAAGALKQCLQIVVAASVGLWATAEALSRTRSSEFSGALGLLFAALACVVAKAGFARTAVWAFAAGSGLPAMALIISVLLEKVTL